MFTFFFPSILWSTLIAFRHNPRCHIHMKTCLGRFSTLSLWKTCLLFLYSIILTHGYHTFIMTFFMMSYLLSIFLTVLLVAFFCNLYSFSWFLQIWMQLQVKVFTHCTGVKQFTLFVPLYHFVFFYCKKRLWPVILLAV